MRTIATRTPALACWLAIGMLSACTVNVKETNDDETSDVDAGGDDTTEQTEDTTEPADREDAGDTTEDDTSDEQTIDVGLGTDGGAATEADGGGDVTSAPEGDGGAPSEWIGCGSRDVSDATTIDTDTIDSDVTWSGTIYVKQYLYVVDGAKLTIEPGTKIIMAVDTDIEFGWNGGAVTVSAAGTPEAPITICGEESEAGYWGSLIFGENVTSNSTFKNVLVSDAGSDNAAVRFNADVHVDNLQVRDSGDVGVEALDFADDSAKLSVFGAQETAVVLTGPGALTNFPLGGTFEGNGLQAVGLDFDSINGDDTVTMHNPGIPYLQLQSLYVEDSSTFEIEAGVNFQFSSDKFLEVGWNGGDSTFFVNGTEDEPVVFEGQSAEAGYWHGVIVGNNVRTNSKVSYLTIAHAGGDNNSALSIKAAITLDHVRLDANENGVLIGKQGLDPDSDNLTITGTESVPLTVEQPDALVTLPQNGTYTGNDVDMIDVDGDTYEVSGTVADLGIPYRVLNTFYTVDGSSLTIEPGVKFVMSADTFFDIGWNGGAAKFIAVGTEEAPIVVEGADDSAGSWGGFRIGENVTTDSAIQYVNISNAGNPSNTATAGAIYLNAAIPVQHCNFSEIAGYGVAVDGEGTTALVTDNTIDGATVGPLLDLTN